MKKYRFLKITILFFVISISGCSSMMMNMMTTQMIEVFESNLDFDETFSYLLEEFEKSDYWEIINTYDNQERYSSEGTMNKFKVIQICNKEVAYHLLSDDEKKYFTTFIPLKVAVYETNNEGPLQVKISLMNTSQFGKMLDDEYVVDNINQSYQEILIILDQIIINTE